MKLEKVAAGLNAVAALGASLQASGTLNLVPPQYLAILVAVLGVLNAVAHAIPSAPPAK